MKSNSAKANKATSTGTKEELLVNMAKAQRRLENEIAKRAEKTAELQKELDDIRYIKIPELMDEMGITNLTIRGIGRVTVTADLRCNVRKENVHDLRVWLEEHGVGDMVTETINGSTLKAFIRRRMQAGEEVPDALVNIHPYSRASITKS